MVALLAASSPCAMEEGSRRRWLRLPCAREEERRTRVRCDWGREMCAVEEEGGELGLVTFIRNRMDHGHRSDRTVKETQKMLGL